MDVVVQDATCRHRAGNFHRSGQQEQALRGQIVALLPALRSFSLALTRNSADADDLLQESMLKALGHVHQFKPGTNLKAWMFTIVRNTFYSGYNKRQRAPTCELNEVNGGHVAPGQEWPIKMRAVVEALRRVPAHQREALLLVACGGLTYEEAAETCGCALGTIRSRLNRARTHLLNELEVDGHGAFLEDGS